MHRLEAEGCGAGSPEVLLVVSSELHLASAPRMLHFAESFHRLCRVLCCAIRRCHLEGSEPGCGAACCWPKGSPVHLPSRQDQHSTTCHEQSVWPDSGRAAAGGGSVLFGGLPGGADSHRLATHSAIRRTRLPGARGRASPARCA